MQTKPLLGYQTIDVLLIPKLYSLSHIYIITANVSTHAYRRLRWLGGLGLAAVGVECIDGRFIYRDYPQRLLLPLQLSF